MSKKSEKLDLGTKDDLQVIVLADDFTTNLTPVENVFPSVLLPVVNVPLLDYIIETLLTCRVQEVYLYCSNHVETLKEYVRLVKRRIDVVISLIINDGCQSFGDALRDIDSKACIRADFILIRGNALASVDLRHFFDAHRTRKGKDKGATMTMLLKDMGSTMESHLKEDACLLLSDASNRKLLYHSKLAAHEKKVKLELQFFLEHDKIQINTNFIDTHIYMCSPSVLSLFSDNFDFQTMEDFIKGILMNEEILDSRIYWEPLSCKDYALPVTSWKSYHIISRDILQRRCYPLVPDAFPFLKNAVYLSRSNYKHRTANLARGCTLRCFSIVGKNSTLGKDTLVTGSVIGDNCKIADNVKLENSYIMSNVVIENSVTIKDSVIFDNCHLHENVDVDGCIVAPSIKLVANESSYVDLFIQTNEGDTLCVTKMNDKNAENDMKILFFKNSYKKANMCDYEDDFDSSSDGSDSESNGISDDESDRESAMSDDTSMFLSEVMDSLMRGYQDKLNCDNLILEINSSRYAYNVSMREVTYNVVKAILNLPLHYLAETKSAAVTNMTYQKTLRVMIAYFHSIFMNYIKTNDAQNDCLRAVEDVAATTKELESFLQHLLHHFYEQDLLAEDIILEWYENYANDDEDQAVRVKKAVQPFIKWLQEAEEDSSEETSD